MKNQVWQEQQSFEKNQQILSEKAGGRVVYISTDYVFDGKNPPYDVDSPTNPLQDYSQSKLDGEKVVLQEDPGLKFEVPAFRRSF